MFQFLPVVGCKNLREYFNCLTRVDTLHVYCRFHLCHCYLRSTRSVKIPAPVYCKHYVVLAPQTLTNSSPVSADADVRAIIIILIVINNDHSCSLFARGRSSTLATTPLSVAKAPEVGPSTLICGRETLLRFTQTWQDRCTGCKIVCFWLFPSVLYYPVLYYRM